MACPLCPGCRTREPTGRRPAAPVACAQVAGSGSACELGGALVPGRLLGTFAAEAGWALMTVIQSWRRRHPRVRHRALSTSAPTDLCTSVVDATDQIWHSL